MKTDELRKCKSNSPHLAKEKSAVKIYGRLIVPRPFDRLSVRPVPPIFAKIYF